MNLAEVTALLEANKDDRGIKAWRERFAGDSGLKTYGIGLTKLRKLAKQVGRNRALALELWESRYYDAKVISLLVDDPKQITREQVERQVEELEGGYLAHVFSACGATLAKTSFVRELADEWMAHADPARRRCGFGLLYELSKSKKKSAPDEAYFLGWVKHIEAAYPAADTDTLMAMGTALRGVGKRTKKLNAAALKVARKIGPIDFDERGKCDPFDVTKHLTSASTKKSLGLG